MVPILAASSFFGILWYYCYNNAELVTRFSTHEAKIFDSILGHYWNVTDGTGMPQMATDYFTMKKCMVALHQVQVSSQSLEINM